MSDTERELRVALASAIARAEEAERRALALEALQENLLARLDAQAHAVRMHHSTHRHAHSLELELEQLRTGSSGELARLQVSPKAQVKALTRSVPKSVAKRLRRQGGE
jgi:hypothetical protein